MIEFPSQRAALNRTRNVTNLACSNDRQLSFRYFLLDRIDQSYVIWYDIWRRDHLDSQCSEVWWAIAINWHESRPLTYPRVYKSVVRVIRQRANQLWICSVYLSIKLAYFLPRGSWDPLDRKISMSTESLVTLITCLRDDEIIFLIYSSHWDEKYKFRCSFHAIRKIKTVSNTVILWHFGTREYVYITEQKVITVSCRLIIACTSCPYMTNADV